MSIFDDEDGDDNAIPVKKSLKVEGKKSMFEDKPKKPSQQALEAKVKQIGDTQNSYKKRAQEYVAEYKKVLEDKTLAKNKNVFSQDLEKELLSNMISLAVEINNDENEYEGMGSLGWITILFKNVLHFRDRCNELEYKLFLIEKDLFELKDPESKK